MFKKVVAIFTTMVLLIALTVVSCAENTNYIFNGSFELLIDGEPSNWMREAYDKSPGASNFRVETEGAKFGEKYVTIINNKLNDSRYSQIVLVEENKKYKLSCYIKTENVSEEGKGANLSVAEQTVTSKRIKGTTDDWEYVELYVITESGVDRIKVTVGLGGYSGMSTGKASFDNVTMEEVETIPEGAPRAVVKAQNTKKSSNNSNNTNNTKSSSSQNNENKNELGKVAFTDGKTIKTMVSSQDHKRALDNDQGLNTGGMGTFSPSRIYTEEIDRYCMERIYKPRLRLWRKKAGSLREYCTLGLLSQKTARKYWSIMQDSEIRRPRWCFQGLIPT